MYAIRTKSTRRPLACVPVYLCDCLHRSSKQEYPVCAESENLKVTFARDALQRAEDITRPKAKGRELRLRPPPLMVDRSLRSAGVVET